jgi:hypothetical protein
MSGRKTGLPTITPLLGIRRGIPVGGILRKLCRISDRSLLCSCSLSASNDTATWALSKCDRSSHLYRRRCRGDRVLSESAQFTLRQTVDALESLDLERSEKDKILYETAGKLLTPKVPD